MFLAQLLYRTGAQGCLAPKVPAFIHDHSHPHRELKGKGVGEEEIRSGRGDGKLDSGPCLQSFPIGRANLPLWAEITNTCAAGLCCTLLTQGPG